MKPVAPIKTIMVLLLLASFAIGQGTTTVSFKQTNFNDPDPIEDVLGVSPLPEASINGGTESSDYDLAADYALDGLTLRTSVTSTVSAKSDDIRNNWKTIEATAVATSELVAIATVQGVPDGSAGTIQFNWLIDGNTKFLLQDVDQANVTLFSALTQLKANIPGAGGVVFDEPHVPNTNADVDLSFPVTETGFSFPVPFTAGTEIPVMFELFSRVDLNVTNPESFGRFRAEMAAEFGNSAVLENVGIFDSNNTLIPSARLVRDDGFVFPSTTMAPEPSTLSMLSVVLVGCFGRWRRR